MIFKEEDIIDKNETLKYNYLNEEKALTEEDFKKDYKNFDEFCKTFNRIEDVMHWYHYNNVQWPKTDPEVNPNDVLHFSWPDKLVKTKIGNCFDHAIFFYYFCKKHNIPARMYRFAQYHKPYSIIDDKWLCDGHIVCVCKLSVGYYVCDYQPVPSPNLYGPFKSFEECAKSYAKEYGESSKWKKKFGLLNHVKEISKVYYSYVSDKDLTLYDKYYNNYDIYQSDLMKLEKDTVFEYDNKSIHVDLFDKIADTIGYYSSSFFNKIRGAIFNL